MTKKNTADRTIEVGYGHDRHSVALATNFLKAKWVLASCDFSQEMVRNMNENYKDSYFGQILGNKYIIEIESDYLSFTDDTYTKLVK